MQTDEPSYEVWTLRDINTVLTLWNYYIQINVWDLFYPISL